MIKDTEYESLGENIFPLQYLTDEERKELGIVEKKCCRNKQAGEKPCSGCSKHKKHQGETKENKCSSCSGCSMCCKKK